MRVWGCILFSISTPLLCFVRPGLLLLSGNGGDEAVLEPVRGLCALFFLFKWTVEFFLGRGLLSPWHLCARFYLWGLWCIDLVVDFVGCGI